MAFGANITTQGLLNRVLTHIIVPAFPALTITAPYMAKGQMVLSFEGPFTDQEPTATGIVNSPRPFVMAQIVVNGLRSQSLAGSWKTVLEAQTAIGQVTAYSDSTVYPSTILSNCSITEFDPGPFDGSDPTVKMTIKGVYYVNQTLWTGIASGLGALV